MGFPGGSAAKLSLQCGRPMFDPLGGDYPLEKGMATHFPYSCL